MLEKVKIVLTAANIIYIGALEINSGENRLVHQDCVRISPKCMKALSLLIAERSQVVSRERFLSEVWSERIGADESLSKAISELRRAFKKLLPGAEKAIVTIPKNGYRLDLSLLEELFPIEVSDVSEPTESMPSSVGRWQAKGRENNKQLIISSIATVCILALLFTTWWNIESEPDKNQTNTKDRLLVLPVPYEFNSDQGEATITEQDIIDLLSQTNQFDVEPLSSTAYFRDQSVSMTKITELLDVDWVLQWRLADAEQNRYLNMLLYRTRDKSIVWRASVPASLQNLSEAVNQKLLSLSTIATANEDARQVSFGLVQPDVMLLVNKTDKLLDSARNTRSVLPVNEAIALLNAAPESVRNDPEVLIRYADAYLSKISIGYVDSEDENAVITRFSAYLKKAEEAGAPAKSVAFLKALFYTPSPLMSARYANKELAAYYFEQAKLAGMQSIRFFANYSYFLIAQEKYLLGKNLLEQALRVHPLSFALHMNYFAVNYRLGNRQVLEAVLAKAQRLFPGQPGMEHAAMLLHMMNGAPDLALKVVQEVKPESTNNVLTALLIYAQFQPAHYAKLIAHLEGLTSHLGSTGLNASFRFARAFEKFDTPAMCDQLQQLDIDTLQSIYAFERIVMQAVLQLPADQHTAHLLSLGQQSAKRQMNSRSFLEVRGLAALFDSAYEKLYRPNSQVSDTLNDVIQQLEILKEKEHGHYHTLAEIYAYTGEFDKALSNLEFIADNGILPSLGRYYPYTKSPFFRLSSNNAESLAARPAFQDVMKRIQVLHEAQGERLSLWLPESLL